MAGAGGPSCGFQEASNLLSKKPNAFADWRWGTLDEVSRALLRFRPLLEWLVSAHGGTLASLFGPSADKMRRDIADLVFWGTLHALQEVLGPIFHMLGWIRGCPCHPDPDGMSGLQRVDCPWKGFRAPELGAKVVDVAGQVLRSIQEFAPASGGGEVALRVAHLGPQVLALFRAKFAWVDDLPCLVWQVEVGFAGLSRTGMSTISWEGR